MLSRLIDLSLANRWLVLILLAAFSVGATILALGIPVDAFPDLTNNQVVVITECPGMPPTEVEQLVTFPLESAMMGLPRTEGIRSMSKLGLSMVTVVFADSVNPYFARQIVNERIEEARGRLPADVKPSLGPIATAFGEVYQYTVQGKDMSLMDRKTLHDWQIKFQLRSIPGINEVNSWGGESKQYVIEVDPQALSRYGLALRTVFERVRENNANFGGGFIEHAGEQYTVLGLGRTLSMADLGNIVMLERGGVAVLLSDVATIVPGAIPRQGAVLRDGKGETVSGMAIMLRGENGLRVIEKVKERIANLHLAFRSDYRSLLRPVPSDHRDNSHGWPQFAGSGTVGNRHFAAVFRQFPCGSDRRGGNSVIDAVRCCGNGDVWSDCKSHELGRP